ncbi:right-handed parallel beta-helix repeat-containing protein [Jiangella aurantiaca]|uniref:Right-handed parallel beta-helix repeat-containing protein n=1 Tax=Jiangella aurantiaca TaxID=2530373 RepID=A0A4V6PEH9_9ACTN|nr:right-handed parallel beta-helix repeat-containing protein [Jiangella aurantiaca]TDD69907.1 right-handed parallel beta-helix repeat-containing protein [Jiangella aurantiaca]
MPQPTTVTRRTVLSMAAAIPLFHGATKLSVAAADADPAAGVVKASDFGFDPEDSTAALTAALASDADVVVIDNVGQDWITGPLWINRDDITVILEDGVTVRGKAAAFPDRRDGIWRIHGRRNVKLIGYGATCVMNKPEYTGEWRANVRMGTSENVTVEGLVLRGAPGDGIITGSGSKNITVRNVVCDDNKRNAISIIYADGLLIEGSAFINTEGTLPEAGIDLEPDTAEQLIKDVVIRDCVFAGNRTYSFEINLMRYRPHSTPASVLVERCYMGPTGDAVVHVQPGAQGPASGSVVFRDCVFDAGDSAGTVNLYGLRGYDGLRATFDRVAFTALRDTPRTDPFVKVWSGLVTVLPEYGNTGFTDCVVLGDLDGPFLAGMEGAGDPMLSNVTGTLWAIRPQQPIVETTGAAQDVDLDVRPISGAATVVVTSDRRWVRAGEAATVTVRRLGDDLAAPLALHYDLSGDARHRVDYDGLPGVAVIPPGHRAVAIPVRARDTAAAAPRELTLTLRPLPGTIVAGRDAVTLRVAGRPDTEETP